MRYRLTALKNGQCGVKDYITFGDEWSERVRTYFLYVWLIEGGERPIVVDTGPADVEEFNAATREYIPIGVTQAPDETTDGALAKAGVDPADVGHVLITHTHGDHFSNYPLFANAKVIVNRNAFPGGAESAPEDLRDRLVLVGDEEVLPGIRTFHVGAHSPDSQGIAIDTAAGVVVLAGDAAYMFENLERDRPIRAENVEACRAALAVLKSRGDVVLPGHDPLIMERYPGGRIA